MNDVRFFFLTCIAHFCREESDFEKKRAMEERDFFVFVQSCILGFFSMFTVILIWACLFIPLSSRFF